MSPSRVRVDLPPRHVGLLIQDHELAKALYRSVSAWPGRGFTWRSAAAALETLIRAAMAAVGTNLERHPRGGLLRQLILDDRELSLTEAGALFELIYSHMVNRFKGDLAEILAIGTMADEVDHLVAEGALPLTVRLELSADCAGHTRESWAKGPDALLCATGGDHLAWTGPTDKTSQPAGDDLVVYAIVEIKSYPLGSAKALAQLASHRERLRKGVRIGQQVWPAANIWFSAKDAGTVVCSPASDSAGIAPASYLVRTPRRLARPPRRSAQLTVFDLAFDQERLMSAGFMMTEWFSGQLGAAVFRQGTNPTPEMTPEEAGFNRLKEALYHVLRLLRFAWEDATDPADKAKYKRWIEVASRLYNAYGWGLVEARRHRGMLWGKVGGADDEVTELDLFD